MGCENHKEKRSSVGSMYGSHWSLSMCFVFSERKYNTSIILPNKAKHYLISLGLKSKMIVLMPKDLSKWSRTMFRIMATNGFFFMNYDNIQKYQNLQEQKTVFNNQLHALEHACLKAKKDDNNNRHH
jgi:hypothetical protein